MKVTIELEELQKIVGQLLKARQEISLVDQALYDFYRKVANRKPEAE